MCARNMIEILKELAKFPVYEEDLIEQSDLEKKLLIALLDYQRGWSNVSASTWVDMLLFDDDEYEEIENRCDKVSGWRKFDGDLWVRLLKTKPELITKCDECYGWSNFTGKNWVEILLAEVKFSEKCEMYQGWVHFTGKDWVDLLSEYPSFTAKCNLYRGWGKIGEHWVDLLVKKPYFADRCTEFKGWELFDGYGWCLLLSRHPQFVKICDEYHGWLKMMQIKPINEKYCESIYPDDENEDEGLKDVDEPRYKNISGEMLPVYSWVPRAEFLDWNEGDLKNCNGSHIAGDRNE